MNRRLGSAAFLLFSLVICQAVPCRAQRFTEYRLGVYLPTGEFLREGGSGFAAGLGLGTRISETLAVEVLAAYMFTSVETSRVPGAESVVSVIPITANLIASRRVRGVRPYVRVGIGAAMSSHDDPFGDEDTTSGLVFRVGAGLAICSLAIDYEYLRSGSHAEDRGLDVSGSVVSFGVLF